MVMMVDALAQRWGCPPSVVMQEDMWFANMVAWMEATKNPEAITASPQEEAEPLSRIPMITLG